MIYWFLKYKKLKKSTLKQVNQTTQKNLRARHFFTLSIFQRVFFITLLTKDSQ
jgi:hypothetical protein